MAEFKRSETKGTNSIVNVAAKAPSDRTKADKKFFVMFLKLKIPFFADFDKKTLKLVIERMVAQYYPTHATIHTLNEEAECINMVLTG